MSTVPLCNGFQTLIAVKKFEDSNADMRYLVLSKRPAGTEDWSEEQLTEIIARDSLVGVTLPKVP